MKLWQKIFLYTLVLVMLAVGITSILLLKNSFSLAMDQKKQSVYNEHEFMITSFKSMLLTERLRQNEIVLEDNKIKIFMEKTFGEHENKNGVAFYNKDMEVLYYNKKTDIPQELLKAVKRSKEKYMQTEDNWLYMASMESVEGNTYYFITRNDISDVVEIHENMLKSIQAISMACAIVIALILLMVVRLLMQPLQKINAGTRAIALGEYEKRIPVKGHDELSELAGNMNRMAAAVERNVKALEDVAEDRKQFIDNLSHEMKTPLTSILGFSDLLQIKKDISEENRIEYAGIIKEEATRMRTLSGKLMELITVGETNIEWKEEEMKELFEETGISLKVITDRQGIEFSCEAQEGRLVVDKELLKSLLYNLVDNAVKASGEGGKITVNGTFQKEEFVVVVEDQGVGIAQDEISKITQAFYMVDKVRGRASGGAGLGLALCAEIAAVHRGSMQFESEQGKGTRVILTMKGGKRYE